MTPGTSFADQFKINNQQGVTVQLETFNANVEFSRLLQFEFVVVLRGRVPRPVIDNTLFVQPHADAVATGGTQ